MEKFTIHFQNRSKTKAAQVIAESETDASNELEANLPGGKHMFQIIEIIPEGIVSGFEIQMFDGKILWL